MEIKPGLRVVRGPDWSWGDQDGGEGCVGTLAELSGSEEDGRVNGKAVVVQWDAGNRCNYRCGVENKYDLSVYDTAQIGIKHVHIVCDICHENGVLGIRWKCVKCHDFDLCTRCYNSGKHNLDHEFIRMEKSDGPRTRVPPRLRAKKLAAKGLFTNAEVIRGHDWLWGEQDGGSGKTGKVSSVKGHGTDNTRSVVDVTWRETKKKNIYRAGHKGMVDVKCKELGSGGYYYPDHLPILGAPYKDAPPPKQSTLSAGEHVKVELDASLLKKMQEGHGGWNDRMADIIGETGTVQSVTDSGDLRVRYPSGMVWTLNADVATKAGGFKVGDVVRIADDMAEVHTLQEDHGGWVDDMALSLAQVGRIKKIFNSGDVRVAVNGRVWTFNPRCMSLAPGEDPPDVPDDADGLGLGLEGLGLDDGDSSDIGMHLKLMSMLDNPAVVVAAAASGDPNMVKQFLSRHPKDVNTKAVGKTAMHCASVGGHVAVVKALLEFNPDLEVEDEDGDKPLHLAAYSDEDEIAQLLIDAGAKVNSKNHKEATPMIIAAVKGHTSVLRILANHPDINLTSPDSDGDTALHCAVLAQKNESVSVLLEAKADPTLLNFRLFTPVHESARIGFLPALEQFVRKDPDLINLRKEDGYTPLHLAALNDHLDVVTMLIDHDGCNIDVTTNDCSTALHAAVAGGHSRVVERLVGFGSNLNIQDQDGDTPLHVVLTKDVADPLTAETPQLKKVRESLSISEDNPSHASATIACFLVQEGASIYVQNKKGHTPLQLSPPDIASLITTFVGKPSSRKFHNSLRAPELPSPVGNIASRHTVMQMEGGSKPPMTVGVPAGKPVTAPVSLSTDGKATASDSNNGAVGGSSEEPVCYLCESKVDVKLEPCNHASLCSSCAQRATRCPVCRVAVKTISKLLKMCPMCGNENATVTLKPCLHQFCPDCARRMKVCFECKVQIACKEGLPPESPSAKAPPGPSSAGNCAICLTEPRNTAFLCGHQLCWDCAQKVDHCPVCRKFVTHRIQLFQ